MLVLSRKKDQEIVIGGNIRIRVLKVKGNTVRLGIDAPQEVQIARGELEQRDSRQATNVPNPADVSANFSIVFETQTSPQQDNRGLMPLDESANLNAMAARTSPPTPGRDCGGAVEFTGRLPETFHRNRLQKIVDRMTSGSGRLNN